MGYTATTAGSSTFSLGMAVQPLTPAIARAVGIDADSKGLVIGAVSGSSDAGRKGLRRRRRLQLAERPHRRKADLLGRVIQQLDQGLDRPRVA